jgi:hypothetical protein
MNLDPFLLGGEAVARATQAFRQAGFITLESPALRPDFFGALLLEAYHQRRGACWQDWLTDQDGAVLKNCVRGYVGRCARMLMSAPGTLQLMTLLTGERVTPSWDASCYTYYEHPGSFLGRHKDKPDECAVAMIVGLESVWPRQAPTPAGNQLRLYTEPVGTTAPQVCTTLPNRVLIFDGKSMPHERPALGAGQRVVIFSCCFRRAQAN